MLARDLDLQMVVACHFQRMAETCICDLIPQTLCSSIYSHSLIMPLRASFEFGCFCFCHSVFTKTPLLGSFWGWVLFVLSHFGECILELSLQGPLWLQALKGI